MGDNSLEFHNSTILEEINILNRNFNFQLDKVLLPIKPTGFNINIESNILIGGGRSLIVKTINIIVLGENESIAANLKIMFTFSVVDNSEYLMNSKGNYDLAPDFAMWLNNIVLATSRGVMYSEFRGTYLDKIVLPLTHPSAIKSN